MKDKFNLKIIKYSCCLFFLTFFAIVGFGFSSFAKAEDSTNYQLGIGVDIPGTDTSSISGYSDYVKAIYKFSFTAGSALTILMLIYAGYKYLTSQGNQQAVNEAKDIIIGSLSGFALLFVIYLIVTILNLNSSQ